MKYLSVCIPTYEMHGIGGEFLKQSLGVLSRQTYKNFEVVISDHSKDDAIQAVSKTFADKLDIKYRRNTENHGSSSANLNNAMRHAEGKLIKILFQDDFLYGETSLAEIVAAFDLTNDHWLITACICTDDGENFYRPFHPTYDDAKILRKNTVSSPSVLTIKKISALEFDDNLIWYMDTDYYKRCYVKFGMPKILDKILVVNRIGKHQITNTLASEEIRNTEYKYILDKFRVKNRRTLVLKRKAKTFLKKILKNNDLY